MRFISLRICGAFVSLVVLLVIVPNARSDDATDWANQQAQAQRDREQAERDRQERENWQNQIAQAQKEREDWYNQQAQAQKEREDWYNQQAQAQKEREDWYNQQAQAQKEREAWDNQQAQAQRDREQAERDRQERENWQNQIAQAQKEREDWYTQQAQPQKEREDWQNQQAQAQRDAEQAQKERDLNEYLNKLSQNDENLMKWAVEQARARQEEINQGQWGAPAAAPPAAVPPLSALPPPQPGAKQPKTYTVTIDKGSQVTRTTFVMRDDGSWHASEGLGIDAVTPAAPVARPMAAPHVRFPAQAIPQQAPMPFDPVAFRQMVRQNQERVRKQIQQTRQQMTQRIGR